MITYIEKPTSIMTKTKI